MATQWLLGWWNLIFALPFGLALVYLGLYTMSGITFGDADVEHDFDVDQDSDVQLHVDADHDVEADHDAEHDGDTEHSAEGEGEGVSGSASAGLNVLQWLGVGRVPLSILLMVMLFTWGWIGFAANMLLAPHIAEQWKMLAASVPAALIGSIFVTHTLAGAIARWLPLCDTSARRKHELLGCVGQAIFPIDEKFGMVSVRDDQGDLYQVACRVSANAAAIAKGEQVKLVAYGGKQKVFEVIAWPLSNLATPAIGSTKETHMSNIQKM